MKYSARAFGSRLVKSATVKLKCINIVPDSYSTQANWAGLWTTYSAAQMSARLALCNSIGANAVKISCSGTPDPGGASYPASSTLFANIESFCQLCRSYGFKIYFNINDGPTTFTGSAGNDVEANVAQNMLVLAWWFTVASDLIVAIDVCNEVNFNQPSTWLNASQMESDLNYLLEQTRATAPQIPVTFSVYMASKTGFAGNALLELQSTLNCDFHDYHPYNSAGESDTTVAEAPGGSDPAQLEAQPWFIGRHLCGECGITTDSATASMTAWVNGMGDQARRAASHGAVLFCDVNYYPLSGSGDYGIFGAEPTPSPIAALTVPFSQWVGAI